MEGGGIVSLISGRVGASKDLFQTWEYLGNSMTRCYENIQRRKTFKK